MAAPLPNIAPASCNSVHRNADGLEARGFRGSSEAGFMVRRLAARAEKFFDIKCRRRGAEAPDAVVQGRDDQGAENAWRILDRRATHLQPRKRRGADRGLRESRPRASPHLEAIRRYPVVFWEDPIATMRIPTPEVAVIGNYCRGREHRGNRVPVTRSRLGRSRSPRTWRRTSLSLAILAPGPVQGSLYERRFESLGESAPHFANHLRRRGTSLDLEKAYRDAISSCLRRRRGYGRFPICNGQDAVQAFPRTPTWLGAPKGQCSGASGRFDLAAGAGRSWWLSAAPSMTMPGLPKHPAAGAHSS